MDKIRQFEQIFCFAFSLCFFNAQIGSFGEKKMHGIFFAVIFIFMLPLDHAVDIMSVSHMNEIWKYILNLNLFQISDLGFS